MYEYNHKTNKKRLVKDVKLKGSPQIIRNEFECSQVLVPSHDGVEIPMNLYYKKGIVKMNRRNRVFMEGYGAYGIPMHQGFGITNLCAMERGWIIA